jgi:hypothetical protein
VCCLHVCERQQRDTHTHTLSLSLSLSLSLTHTHTHTHKHKHKHTHTHTHTHVIYVCVCRERDREERDGVCALFIDVLGLFWQCIRSLLATYFIDTRFSNPYTAVDTPDKAACTENTFYTENTPTQQWIRQPKPRV